MVMLINSKIVGDVEWVLDKDIFFLDDFMVLIFFVGVMYLEVMVYCVKVIICYCFGNIM